MNRPGAGDDRGERGFQLAGGGVEIVAQGGVLGGEALLQIDQQIAVGEALQAGAQRAHRRRLRRRRALALLVALLALGLDRHALAFDVGFAAAPLDLIGLEHLHRLGHVANLVAPPCSLDAHL